jgi:outer membrane receptor protein involved in Fe transport
MKLLHRQTADVRARLCVDAATAGKATHETLSGSLKKGCVLGLSLAGALSVSAAWAQENQDDGGLEEIVVTATRQVDTVNRVPLSIQAVTAEAIDQQGIKNTQDLIRTVPGLYSVQAVGGSQQTFSIRGIVGATGAATTGTYLDDTNMAKRSNGGISQNNGVVVPLLYDLERVEVLKGPQGTLYGGSSQGGTVRYITTMPSLTEMTGKARAEASSMGSRSEMSHEFAAAFGGPIVDEKLAFRISGIHRETGGYVDMYSGYNGRLIEEDSNGVTEWAGRAALLWQVTENFDAMISGYHANYETEGGPGSETELFTRGGPTGASIKAPAGTTYTTQSRCVPNATATRTTPYTSATPGVPGAQAYAPPNTPAPPGGCGAAAFTRPAYTYGPYRTGQDIAIVTGRQEVSPQESELQVAALTLNFDFGPVSLKSISSYLTDKTVSDGGGGGEVWTATQPNQGQVLTVDPTHRGFPMFMPYFLETGQGNTGRFLGKNERDGFEQEFRLASGTDGRFSYVAGAYYSDLETDITYRWPAPPSTADLALTRLYGPVLGQSPGANGSASFAYYGVENVAGSQSFGDTTIKEKESAVFVEANYWILPDKLKAIAGVRYSKVELDFATLNHGQQNGRLPSSFGSQLSGKTSDKPVTPKFGLQYQFTDDKMAYATASKGFRAGGINPSISPTFCAPQLAALGLQSTDIPAGFEPDTVWSYELGTKLRLTDTLQVNMAAFRIDWEDIQATTTLTCGQGFTTSGGKARSEGGELSVQFRPVSALNLYLNASYTDSYYVDPVVAPTGAGATSVPLPSFNAGDNFDIPPFAASAGAQVDFTLFDSLESYVRLDGSYQDDYTAGATFNSGGWGGNYFNRNNEARKQFNLRAGLSMDNGLDANLFVQNLTNEDALTAGQGDGRGVCANASPTCDTYSTFTPFQNRTYQRPRLYGVQVNYKFGATRR